ncbi:glycosyl transferase [Halorubrum sp. Ib24]|uniref:glycosyltransferase family 2 protein n=1 Tax=Halorubrum sp. Ib24 TaxID=1383850 RepID=UPI000B991183|nr:glycosyltransferase family A protein [Halorubrum sp. Ib24]OYR38953.1 glycosyl transferase [Halorubrum sp. Ib24]
MVRYSIAVCNYNMADTLERSLRSIVDQVDDSYEVVVVDGGSTDGSRDILRELEDEYAKLRAILHRADEYDTLGGDRNIAVEESNGDYVFVQLDADNRFFDGVIEDFAAVYHQLESGMGRPFFLSGMSINIAPRSLLMDHPYPNLPVGEDRHLWQQLFAEDAILWLEHGSVCESIGYDKDFSAELKRDIRVKICDFQSGITLRSALAWSLHHDRYYILERDRGPLLNTFKKPYDFLSHCYAYWKARDREQYDTPPGFETKGTLECRIAEERKPLNELADQYGIEVDCSQLSETGRHVYCQKS